MTKNMTGGKAFQYGAFLAATVFSMWADWNVIGHALKGDSGWLYQALCLFFIDFGIIGWAFYLSDGAESDTQRTVAGMMLVYCFIAAFAGVAGEVWFLVDAQAGKRSAFVTDVIPWMIIVSVMVNLAASLICHFSDPNTRRISIQKRIQSEIEAQELNEMEKAAPTFALDMGRARAQANIAVMKQSILAGLPQLPAPQIIESTARPVTSQPNAPTGPELSARPLTPPPPLPELFSRIFQIQPQQPQPAQEETPGNFTQPRRQS